jgi:hypothetical protein
MYADDLIVLARSESALQRNLNTIQSYCNKWHLTVSVQKTKIIIFNTGKSGKLRSFRLASQSIEIVTSFCYLGVEINANGSFKQGIARAYNKASKAYFSLRRDFNFYNGTSPKTIMHLFDIMIQPIALYCSEIWGCYSWRKQTEQSLKNWITSTEDMYEKLHIKMCKNVLGLSKYISNDMTRGELGRSPLSVFIIRNIYSYWQHVLNSPKSTLVHHALIQNIALDRKDQVTYYTRIKTLLAVLEERPKIYPVPSIQVKKCAMQVKIKAIKIYQNNLYDKINTYKNGSLGRYEIFAKTKKNFNMPEQYLFNISNPKMRKNITKIRLSAHNFPIETLRKKNIPRNERFCHMCDNTHLGTEYHMIMLCKNNQISLIREELLRKMINTNIQFLYMNSPEIFIHLLMAQSADLAFYFGIFLGKLFKLIEQATTQ